jgi:ubiquinone/menaquinone biosynthesis C-methylase UbiE
MNWYDLVAPVYDRAIRALYLPYRQKAVATLRLEKGHTVLDLGCGSGLNFELIREAIGPEGTLIGVDFSAQMLDRARALVAQRGWTNVHLLQQDARELDLTSLGKLRLDRVICTLGLSVFPDWQGVFAKSFNLLSAGGRYCVMDLFNDRSTVQSRLVNFLADSEISRRVWEPLQAECSDYAEERHRLMHGSDVVVIASGAFGRPGVVHC